MNEKETQRGNIKISEEVINSIVTIAARETEGISSVASAAGIDFFGKKNHSKSIRTQIVDNTITIDISVLVKYGVIINDVALKLQEAIAVSVESMTGMAVTAVNVTVIGISFDDKTRESK
ncbi:MAG: Asp23/Gls24 family envelope stress response protein [Clostridiales bacterium]|nr:Asp23/Gls24 family envelope stress response protein [Clostridiales bacterium]